MQQLGAVAGQAKATWKDRGPAPRGGEGLGGIVWRVTAYYLQIVWGRIAQTPFAQSTWCMGCLVTQTEKCTGSQIRQELE